MLITCPVNTDDVYSESRSHTHQVSIQTAGLYKANFCTQGDQIRNSFRNNQLQLEVQNKGEERSEARSSLGCSACPK